MKYSTKLVRFLLLAIISTLSVIALSACQGKEAAPAQDQSSSKPKVVTTIYPLQYMAERIAGDNAQVESLIPNGVEPHGYEPSAQDIIKIEDAKMFVMNGAGMELWAEDMLASSKNKDLTVVDTSKNTQLLASEGEEEHEHEHEHAHEADDHDHEASEHEHEHEHEGEEAHHHHSHGPNDPHLWLSPKRALAQAEAIYEGLIAADPSHKDDYQKNYDALKSELSELDASYTEELSKLSHKSIVTSHTAFAYLANDYGLKQLGLAGVNGDVEPSPKDMARIVDFVKDNNVSAIFTEELVSPKVAEAVSKETGAKLDTLFTIEAYTEDMKNNNDDYISLLKKNLETLKKDLA